MIPRHPDDRNLPLRLATNCGIVVAAAVFAYVQYGPMRPDMIVLFIGGFLGVIPAAVVEDRWQQEFFGTPKMLSILGFGGGAFLGLGAWELVSWLLGRS